MPGPFDFQLGVGLPPQAPQIGQPQALPLIKYLMETLNIGQESAMKLAARLGPSFSPQAASTQVAAAPVMSDFANRGAYALHGATSAAPLGIGDSMAPRHDDTLRLEQLRAMANYPGGGASRVPGQEPGVIDSSPRVSSFPSFTVQSDGHSTDNEQPMFATPKDYAAADYIGPNQVTPRVKPAKVAPSKAATSDMPSKKSKDSDD